VVVKGRPKKRANCQSKDVFENGFCKHHGGEDQSLTQRRLVLSVGLAKLKAEKAAKRMERWKKKNPALR
jgi:hypothetical protein